MDWEKYLTRSIGSRASVVLHTAFFIFMFLLYFVGVNLNTILLVLTTIVSLEAIYLAIFIQMTVNKNTESLEEVEEGIDEIQEDVDEIQEDVDEIQEDVGELQEDIGEINEEIHEDTEEEKKENMKDEADLDQVRKMLEKILEEVDRLKKR